MTVIDMQRMMYINLLDRESNIRTNNCFFYNNMIVYAVPRNKISKAIGPGASNVRKLQDKLGKKIRIIGEANGLDDAARFISDIIAPVMFKSLEIKERMLILTAGNQNKAALLGRNKRRYEEMKTILMDTFGMDFKIV